MTKSRLRHLFSWSGAICLEVDFQTLIRNFLVMRVKSTQNEDVVSHRIDADDSWPDNLPEIVRVFRVSLLFGLSVLLSRSPNDSNSVPLQLLLFPYVCERGLVVCGSKHVEFL